MKASMQRDGSIFPVAPPSVVLATLGQGKDRLTLVTFYIVCVGQRDDQS